jgi:hypothetical protein
MVNPLTYKQFGEEPLLILQSDYQFSHNGYGLCQLTLNYSTDISGAGESRTLFRRGLSNFYGDGPLGVALGDLTWTAIRAEEKGRDGNIANWTVHFAAIDSVEGNGETTATEATLTSAAVSEPIETHPNFSKILIPQMTPSKGTPLGGKLTETGPPLTMNNETNPYRAKWLPGSIPGAFNYQFVGFLPQQKLSDKVNIKAGVKSFFRPSVTMKLTAYTSNTALATDTCKYTGWATRSKAWGVFQIPDAYSAIALQPKLIIASDDEALTKGPSWLITGINMEVFGGLYKIQADLLLSGPMGWDADIYPYQSA